MKVDTVTLRAAMRPDSEARGELKKGDVVRVELEVSGGPDGAWCSVADLDGKRLGYVPSATLERAPAVQGGWSRVGGDSPKRGSPAGGKAVSPRGGKSANPRGGKAPTPRGGEGIEDFRPLRPGAGGTRAYSEIQVEFFMARWCGWCNKTRALLNSLGVSVAEYDIDAQPERKAELVARSGQTGVPFLDIEGITMVGFSERAIRDAIERRRAEP